MREYDKVRSCSDGICGIGEEVADHTSKQLLHASQRAVICLVVYLSVEVLESRFRPSHDDAARSGHIQPVHDHSVYTVVAQVQGSPETAVEIHSIEDDEAGTTTAKPRWCEFCRRSSQQNLNSASGMPTTGYMIGETIATDLVRTLSTTLADNKLIGHTRTEAAQAKNEHRRPTDLVASESFSAFPGTQSRLLGLLATTMSSSTNSMS